MTSPLTQEVKSPEIPLLIRSKCLIVMARTERLLRANETSNTSTRPLLLLQRYQTTPTDLSYYWHLELVNDVDVYRIISLGTGLQLQVDPKSKCGSKASLTSLGHDGPCTLWRISSISGDETQLINLGTGLCLDDTGVQNQHVEPHLWNADSRNVNQRFYIVKELYHIPRVTIVMSTYNRPIQLPQAIQSIVVQHFSDWVLYIVGDKCPTLEQTMQHLVQNNPNVKTLIDQGKIVYWNLDRNYGAGGATPRNSALNKATSEWIAYLDDDNTWTPVHLHSLFALIDKDPSLQFVYSSFQYMPGGALRLCTHPPKLAYIDTSCVVHRRSLISKYGGWKQRSEAGYGHDWELFSRWATTEKSAVTLMPTMKYAVETSTFGAFDHGLLTLTPDLILGHAQYQTSLQLVQQMAEKHHIKTFHHHFHLLLPLAELIGAETYLEVGSYQGASLALVSHGTKIKTLIAVDPCQSQPDQANVIRHNVKTVQSARASTAQLHVFPVSSRSPDALNFLKGNKLTIDLLFLDGSKTFGDIIQDFRDYEPLVRPGGVIVFDDYNDHVFSAEVKSAVDWCLDCKPSLQRIGCLPNQSHAFAYHVAAREETNGCFIVQKS